MRFTWAERKNYLWDFLQGGEIALVGTMEKMIRILEEAEGKTFVFFYILNTYIHTYLYGMDTYLGTFIQSRSTTDYCVLLFLFFK